MDCQLFLKDINKSLDDGTIALKEIRLALKKGTRLSVLGPSGSGKTTLLRMIAGLDSPDSGRIFFNGRDITNTSAHKRNFGLMFQDYALFPHLNVAENIGFGLKMRGLSKKSIAQKTDRMLEWVGLKNFGNRRVDDLSGGEQQRVALARTLAFEPELLMLDEPLSSLDRNLRKKLLAQMTDIISTLNITTIFVTHDHEEAFAAGNLLMIMNEGRIVQMETRDQIMAQPASEWVIEFLGLET